MGDIQRHLRSVGDLETAVETTIASLTAVHIDEDAGAIELARKYARAIDEAKDPKVRDSHLRWIAPQLLDCLESLGATPASRARMKGAKVADAGPSALDELRAKRTRRSA